MSDLVPIKNQNQRVLLTSQLAEEYETTPEVISNNFNRNKERYQAGKHFYCLEGNKRRRMADEGACKSKRDRLNKVDVIAEDKKLIEIYVAIVKEVAVKYGIDKKISAGMGQAHETINNILG